MLPEPENRAPELQSLVSPLLLLSREAGDLICAHYRQPGAAEFSAKADDSPLTQADLDSNDLLERGLAALAADIPVLSEESAQRDVRERRRWRRFWLVDPLDGTREFLERTGEFTINIALVEDGRPVLGILYLPLLQAAYVGIPGVESRRYTLAADGSWSVHELATRTVPDDAPLTVLASRRHRGPKLQQCLRWLERETGPLRRLDSGSAIKFCQLAEGLGDIYPRFTPCCEWDTAAGQAVVEAAGGALLGVDGAPLRYNERDTLLSPHFYAVGQPDHPLWVKLLAAD